MPSLGSHNQQDIKPLKQQLPFGYDADDGFSSNRKRSPMFGFSTATRFKQKTPNLGQSSFNGAVRSTALQVGVGSQPYNILENRRSIITGPTTYTPRINATLRGNPAYSVSKSAKSLGLIAQNGLISEKPGPLTQPKKFVRTPSSLRLNKNRELTKSPAFKSTPSNIVVINEYKNHPQLQNIETKSEEQLLVQMLPTPIPGVGQYNLVESSEKSSTIKRNPKFSFGSQKRKTVITKDGPGPFDYQPDLNYNLKRAPVAIVPNQIRLISATSSRNSSQQQSTKNRTRATSPGPGDYYLPAAFARRQSHSKF